MSHPIPTFHTTYGVVIIRPTADGGATIEPVEGVFHTYEAAFVEAQARAFATTGATYRVTEVHTPIR